MPRPTKRQVAMKTLANEKKKMVNNQPAAVEQVERQVMNDAIVHPMRTLFAPVDVAHHYVDAYRNGRSGKLHIPVP
ncbi:hypothetical protein QR680_009275 [Steinernema hermaphroditum]|uniref:Uncharacterized protein n=1 Tax=Steinernema hermaphroditum TaxID=289476 RepID=A0AA39IL29_9BILA|nr:hypothetical protein QR680_009275 [Steinernema hermaphroditum]